MRPEDTDCNDSGYFAITGVVLRHCVKVCPAGPPFSLACGIVFCQDDRLLVPADTVRYTELAFATNRYQS